MSVTHTPADPAACHCKPDSTGKYTRTCEPCGTRWFSAFCPHSKAQNACPTCGYVSTTDMILAGVRRAPRPRGDR